MLDNYESIIFESGMFRSGTTLLARILNTHSQITFAADIMVELFRFFRNELYHQHSIEIPKSNYPIEHNFKSKNIKLKKQIENSNLDLNIKFIDLKELFERTQNYSSIHSEIFSEKLDSLTGNNFLEIFNKLLMNIHDSYSKQNSKVLGFKTVWCDQFVPVFLNQFKEKGKAIFVIRDPRAVIASNYVKNDHRYPLEFLIRHWRKSVCYAILYNKIDTKFSNRTLIVKYEDLIAEPKIEIKKILDFVGLSFEQELLDPTQYKDGQNKQWEQNTSYGDPSLKLNTENINKWEKALPDNVKKFIEFSCLPEMLLLGYKPRFFTLENLPEKIEYPPDDYSKFAQWIKEFYSQNIIEDKKWIEQIGFDESKRMKIFRESEPELEEIDEYFIDKRFHQYLVNNINKC